MSITWKALRRLSRLSHAGVVLAALNQPTALGVLYGGTDKVKHGYMPVYANHLGGRRFERNLVFEIGVGGYGDRRPGGSLAIWRDYFVRSRVVGIDLHDKDVHLGHRVSFQQADQSSEADLRSVVDRHGPPDIVIDDGSHIGEHVLASFRFLFPLLRPGGIYVIEDLSTSYDPERGGGDPPPEATAVGLLQGLVNCAQSEDPTFLVRPDWGPAPKAPPYPGVKSVHVYPGIAVVNKVA